MRLDELSKSWPAAAAQRLTHEMSFDGEFLVLGAQTRLAKVGAAPDEAQLTALLTATHGRPIAASSLRHVQRGLEKKRDGELVLALIHLALSGVAKLREPKEDARRLFIADALMRQGVDPVVVVKGMLALAHGDLDKYNPDQPRVPAGNPDGGQWTAGDSAGAATSPRPQRPGGIQVADASSTRGIQVADASTSHAPEVMSGATPAAYPGDFHDQILDEQIDAYRKAGADCVSEVRLQLGSVTARLDILCRAAAGVVLGVEIKTGEDPDFTLEQRIVYPHTLAGAISSPDQKIQSLGVAPGEPLPPFPIFILRADGPGRPYRFYGPKPSK